MLNCSIYLVLNEMINHLYFSYIQLCGYSAITQIITMKNKKYTHDNFPIKANVQKICIFVRLIEKLTLK